VGRRCQRGQVIRETPQKHAESDASKEFANNCRQMQAFRKLGEYTRYHE
jgi:hypothetical protein